MAISVAYLASTPYSATDARRALVASMAHNNASGFVVRSGVIPSVGTALQIASAGSLFVSIAPGQGVVDGQYVVTNDASVNVTVAPGTAATRWDAVILRVQETALGDGANSVSFQVVQGTTTSIPTLPARSLLLGTVVVGAGVTSINSSNIVDRRTYTTGSGGILQVNGVPTTSDLVDGAIAYDLGAGVHYTRRGSAINRLLPVVGAFDGTLDGNGIATITHNLGRFPFIQVTMSGDAPNNAAWAAWQKPVTVQTSTSIALIKMFDTRNASVCSNQRSTFHWLAM